MTKLTSRVVVLVGLTLGAGLAFASGPFQNGDFEAYAGPFPAPLTDSFSQGWGDINTAASTHIGGVTIQQSGADEYAHLQGSSGSGNPFQFGTYAGMKQTFNQLGSDPLTNFSTITVSFDARGYGLSRLELGDGSGIYAALTDVDSSANSTVVNVAPFSDFTISKSGAAFEHYSYTFARGTASIVNLFFKSDFADSSFDVNNVTVSGSNVTLVPEPESYAMMLAGLGALGFMARRRKAR